MLPPGKQPEITDMGWEVYPESIYKVLMQFSKYPVKEIIVTENGAAFTDQLVDGQVHDQQRISFYKRYPHNILQTEISNTKFNTKTESMNRV